MLYLRPYIIDIIQEIEIYGIDHLFIGSGSHRPMYRRMGGGAVASRGKGIALIDCLDSCPDRSAPEGNNRRTVFWMGGVPKSSIGTQMTRRAWIRTDLFNYKSTKRSAFTRSICVIHVLFPI